MWANVALTEAMVIIGLLVWIYCMKTSGGGDADLMKHLRERYEEEKDGY